VRLPLDVMMVFTANPEDYTARGKIITPLKDRIGSEIRTHYPATRHEGMRITEQESWTSRRAAAEGRSQTPRNEIRIPAYVREVVEEIAFQARQDQKVDKRSGVSQRMPITCLENTVSNAERRALLNRETEVVPRVTDIYSAMPSITGKFELEYEGELRGADNVARELIRSAVANVFNGWFGDMDCRAVIEWFELGGTLQLDDTTPASQLVEMTAEVQGLHGLAARAGGNGNDGQPELAAAIDFVLEGLYATKKISRSEERTYAAVEPARARQAQARSNIEDLMEREVPQGGKKRYYN
jgi:magnesium chelatase subunit I